MKSLVHQLTWKMPMAASCAFPWLIALVLQCHPSTARPMAPTYVDDTVVLDRLSSELSKLAAAGKCLSPAERQRKTETDHPCRIAPVSVARRPRSPEVVAAELRASVYLIGCVKRSKSPDAPWDDGWFATAWAVTSDGVRVTNWHVFDDASEMYFGVIDANGRVFPVTDILACDKKADVAVIRIGATTTVPLPVAMTPAAVGSWVGVLSHPGNQPFAFTQGHVSRYARNFGGPEAVGEKWMCITADYAGGSSGGPVVDATGSLVGMACMTSNIDHSPSSFDRRKRTGRSRPTAAAAPTIEESRVQMVVKLTVPSAVIRKVLSADGSDDEKPLPLAELAAEMKRRFTTEEDRVLRKLARETGRDTLRTTGELDDLRSRYSRGLLRLVETAPKTPTVRSILGDVLAQSSDQSFRVVELLDRHHATADGIAEAVLALADDLPDNAPDFLDKVLTKNPHRPEQAAALFALGMSAKRRAKTLTDDDQAEAIAEAEKHFARIRAEHVGVKIGREQEPITSRTAKAAAGLKNLPQLAVDKPAPELAGEDLDGVAVKLSQFRGKVVLVDFWALWAAASVDRLRVNRDLVENNVDQPFVLLGVNADPPGVDLAVGLKKNRVNWRSLKNAQGEAGEPELSDTWNVDSFPTSFLIDHTGVIRNIWTSPPDAKVLADAVAKWVAEAAR